ncbi:MAG TPA: hypothetical protein VFN53_13830, partial [Acidobacteriaceae bacterium]|nr:hypothetical protein [Acidobacteriaceae bacterium]
MKRHTSGSLALLYTCRNTDPGAIIKPIAPITNQYSIPQRYDAIAHHHVRSGQELMGMKNWPENTPKTRYMVVGL